VTQRIARRLPDDLGGNIDYVSGNPNQVRMNIHPGLDTVRFSQLMDQAGQLGAQIAVVPNRRFQVEDEAAQLGDGGVQPFDGFVHFLAVAGVFHPRGETLQDQTGGKEILDDGVVKVAGDSLPIFDHCQSPQLLLEPDIGHR
jgi:hypothetical protein